MTDMIEPKVRDLLNEVMAAVVRNDENMPTAVFELVGMVISDLHRAANALEQIALNTNPGVPK